MINLLDLFGVAEGEEFKIKDCGATYKVENNVLMFLGPRDEWVESSNLFRFNELNSIEIERLPFEPKYGDIYYYINNERIKGYTHGVWGAKDIDKRIKSRTTLYRTEAEIQAEVKKLGWVTE